MKTASILLLVLVSVLSCAHQNRAPLLSRSIAENAPVRSSLKNAARHRRIKVISKAREQLKHHKTYRSRSLSFQTDPIGFIQAAYWNAGIDLFDSRLALDLDVSGLVLIYETARKRRQLVKLNPRPGDLIFLKSAKSPQAEAGIPDQLGIIESIDSNRTITALGFFANGAHRVVVNADHRKREYGEGGKRINDRLSADRDNAGRLAGALVVGFADPFETLPGDIRIKK